MIPVPYFEGYYMINKDGEVYSIDRVVEKETHNQVVYGKKKIPTLKPDGLVVTLFKEGRGRTFRLHRLVAELFVPNPDGLPCVKHKDGDMTNVRSDNLYWSRTNKERKLTDHQVESIRRLKRNGMTIKGISEMFPVATSTIAAIVHMRKYKQ